MNKDIEWGISGNKERIFVSAALGCSHHCTYCYLPRMQVKAVQFSFTKKELLDELDRRGIFIPGKQGSLVTIGCFTECWDEINRETTIQMINFFLRQGNYVQISTKKEIAERDIISIKKNIQFQDQMNIFVSLPTLSYAKSFEPDADSPDMRIKNLDIKRRYGINTYIYIKPVIESITIKDKRKYKKLVKQYRVPVIIGELMYPVSERNSRHFFIGKVCMKEYRSDDSDKLARFLGKYTDIYKHSDDAIKQIRKNMGKQNESTNYTSRKS